MKRIIAALVILLFMFIMWAWLPVKEQSMKKEVVFWTLQMGDFAPYMNKVITNFEAVNPDIEVKWIDVPFSEGEKRTLAAILSDNPPSLVNLNPDFSAMLAQKGALLEIQADNLPQFNQEIIDSLKVNEKIYSIPWYATSAITIYNKKMLTESPKTYLDAGIMAEEVKKRTGAYIFMPTITENDTMLKILNKNGIYSSNDINSEKAAEIFEFYKNLYHKGLIPPESITQTHREALEKYMSGNIAMFQGGANFLNIIKENAPNIYKDTDVAEQLKGTMGQNDFSLMNFVIPLKSKNKAEALRFALFLTNAENQLELAKLTNVLATNRLVLQDTYYREYTEENLMAKARVISATQLNNIKPVIKQSKNQKEVNTLINTAVQQILLNKGKTRDILNSVSKKWLQLSY